jgi:hypothetical protein
MPNWCENILKITGPTKDLARFKKAVQGRGARRAKEDPVRPFSFHSLVPMPEFPAESDGWYNWSIAHWGTKWDASEPRIISESKTCLEYGFDTAWSPPMEWLASVGPKFPMLTLRLWYAEGGSYFAGVYTVEGDDANNEEKDYVDAQIEERGSISVQCGYCDEDIEISDKAAVRICEDCLQYRCTNCEKHQDEHIDGKCPFDATMFKNISPEKVE